MKLMGGYSIEALCRHGRRANFGLMLCLACGLLSSCAWLDAKQRSVVYRPTLGVPSDFPGLKHPDERYFLTIPQSQAEVLQCSACAPERIELWWLPHENINAPVLLYFHGTFRNLYQNTDKINALRRAGFAVLGVDYRGWGQSTAITPSERSIMQDADLAWQELARKVPNPAKRVIYGHSMGSGVAVDVASRLRAGKDYAGLILESAFTSFPDVATATAPRIGPLLAAWSDERFDSLSKIKNVDAPLLMLHGKDDDTIPQHLGQQLFTAAHEPKIWLSVPKAKHSDAHALNPQLYMQAVQAFQKIMAAAQPTQSNAPR